MTQTQQQNVPALRFPEFGGEWLPKTLLELSKNGFSNGVFNDPRKVGSGHKLINVKDMYKENEVSLEDLSLLDLSQKEFENNKVVCGDVLFTRSSLVKEGIAYSCVFLSDDENTTYDGHLIRMSPDGKQVFPQYLGYALKTDSSRRQLVARGKTTTMTTIGQEDISSVVMALGETTEQQKIASFLSAIDTKIAQLTNKKALLEQYKKSVMQKLFSGSLRFPEFEAKPRRVRDGYTISKLGAFPVDWTIERADRHLWFQEGPGVRKTQFTKSGVKLFNGTNIQNNAVNLKNTLTYISNEEADGNYRHFLADEGDLVIACSGISVDKFDEKIAFLTSVNLPLCMNTSTMRFKASGEQLNIRYFSYFMRTPIFKNQIRRQITGSAQLNFGPSHVATFLIVLPSIPEQQKIANFLSAIDRKIDLVTTELNHAKTFKKGLLQQMFV